MAYVKAVGVFDKTKVALRQGEEGQETSTASLPHTSSTQLKVATPLIVQ